MNLIVASVVVVVMPSTSFANSAYSNHPIQIPPDFPKILKQYTKAAIRTQPRDLLLWSVSYFRQVVVTAAFTYCVFVIAVVFFGRY